MPRRKSTSSLAWAFTSGKGLYNKEPSVVKQSKGRGDPRHVIKQKQQQQTKANELGGGGAVVGDEIRGMLNASRNAPCIIRRLSLRHTRQ